MSAPKYFGHYIKNFGVIENKHTNIIYRYNVEVLRAKKDSRSGSIDEKPTVEMNSVTVSKLHVKFVSMYVFYSY